MLRPPPHTHRVPTLAFVLVTTTLSRAAEAQDVAALVARIERGQPSDTGLAALGIRALLGRIKVPGVSIAVVHDFDILWAKGYGIADVDTGKPVDVHTAFRRSRSASRSPPWQP